MLRSRLVLHNKVMSDMKSIVLCQIHDSLSDMHIFFCLVTPLYHSTERQRIEFEYEYILGCWWISMSIVQYWLLMNLAFHHVQKGRHIYYHIQKLNNTAFSWLWGLTFYNFCISRQLTNCSVYVFDKEIIVKQMNIVQK